jgi:hypothetical protein
VIATRPTTAPVHDPSAEGFSPRILSNNIQDNMAEAEAMWVVMKACDASGDADSAEPALKPNHPNHSRPVPSRT